MNNPSHILDRLFPHRITEREQADWERMKREALQLQLDLMHEQLRLSKLKSNALEHKAHEMFGLPEVTS